MLILYNTITYSFIFIKFIYSFIINYLSNNQSSGIPSYTGLFSSSDRTKDKSLRRRGGEGTGSFIRGSNNGGDDGGDDRRWNKKLPSSKSNHSLSLGELIKMLSIMQLLLRYLTGHEDLLRRGDLESISRFFLDLIVIERRENISTLFNLSSSFPRK